jgi:hypothetical protein
MIETMVRCRNLMPFGEARHSKLGRHGIKSVGHPKRKFFNSKHLNARGDLNPILGFSFPLFSGRFPGEFPSG